MSSYFVLFLKQTVPTPYIIFQTPPFLFPLAKLAVRRAAPARPPCGLGRQEKNRPRYAAVFFPAKPCRAAAAVCGASGKQVWRPIEPPMSNLKTSDYGKELSIGTYQANRQIINKVETLASKGDVEMVRKAVGLVTEYNNISEKPAVTERNRLFRMEEKAFSVRSRIESDYGNRNKEIHFDGRKLILNREADRLQIVYDHIPDDETRKRMKSSGFRWAPTNRAWQRHLTQNSIRATERLLGIDIELSKKQEMP